MRGKRRLTGTVRLALVAGLVLVATNEVPAPTKVLDRKFPQGTYCPVETRAAAGVDLSFVAPASTISISFSGMNQNAASAWNGYHVDNVAVVLKSVHDANLLSPSPFFENCYIASVPPGQTTPGIPGAPSYDFNAASTPEVFLDLFGTGITGWTGQHQYHDTTILPAPTVPLNPVGTETGGSLGFGLASDGQVPVSATRSVSGLTAGQTYVLSFWWYAKETSPITLTIGVPCPDGDADGFVVCSACDPLPSKTCGECNDANVHCGTNCADLDADGWCVTTDCDDGAATCTNNCAPDTDTDAIADCRDGCLDPDRDGYGVAGGAPSTCLGPDCSPANQWCNVSCVDTDGDGHCAPGDCQDNNPVVANGLAEVNDSFDQNCPGEEGFGVIDEISGISGFPTPVSPFTWTSQTGALNYLAVRSSSALFTPPCGSLILTSSSWSDPSFPTPGSAQYYLVRPQSTNKGSWGQRSNGVERAVICGAEADCDNNVDDDLDTTTDCADTDCAGTAACKAATFTFLDTTADDITDTAFASFLQATTAGANDYFFFEINDSGRVVSWCSINAGYYKTQYLNLASTQGTATSGIWNKWRKAPQTSNLWAGPTTAGNLNTYGNDCFGFYSWCSEQFSTEPKNSIFPNRTNDCEIYDLSNGSCGASIGGTWRLTIKIASTRALACGF